MVEVERVSLASVPRDVLSCEVHSGDLPIPRYSPATSVRPIGVFVASSSHPHHSRHPVALASAWSQPLSCLCLRVFPALLLLLLRVDVCPLPDLPLSRALPCALPPSSALTRFRPSSTPFLPIPERREVIPYPCSCGLISPPTIGQHTTTLLCIPCGGVSSPTPPSLIRTRYHTVPPSSVRSALSIGTLEPSVPASVALYASPSDPNLFGVVCGASPARRADARPSLSAPTRTRYYTLPPHLDTTFVSPLTLYSPVWTTPSAPCYHSFTTFPSQTMDTEENAAAGRDKRDRSSTPQGWSPPDGQAKRHELGDDLEEESGSEDEACAGVCTPYPCYVTCYAPHLYSVCTSCHYRSAGLCPASLYTCPCPEYLTSCMFLSPLFLPIDCMCTLHYWYPFPDPFTPMAADLMDQFDLASVAADIETEAKARVDAQAAEGKFDTRQEAPKVVTFIYRDVRACFLFYTAPLLLPLLLTGPYLRRFPTAAHLGSIDELSHTAARCLGVFVSICVSRNAVLSTVLGPCLLLRTFPCGLSL